MADKPQDDENTKKNKKLNQGSEPEKKSGEKSALTYAYRQSKEKSSAGSSNPTPEKTELEKNAALEEAAILSKQVLDLLKMKPK